MEEYEDTYPWWFVYEDHTITDTPVKNENTTSNQFEGGKNWLDTSSLNFGSIKNKEISMKTQSAKTRGNLLDPNV